MIKVKLPGGTVVNFPDGTPPETIKSVMDAKFGQQDAPGGQALPQEQAAAQSGQASPQAGFVNPIPGADALNTFASNMGENFGFGIGPAVTNAADYVGSNIAHALFGVDPEKARENAQEIQQAQNARNPGAAQAGAITGAMAPYLALGGSPLGQKALGMPGTGSLLSRSGMSAATMGVGGGLDTLARTGDAGKAVKSGAINAGIGAVVPGAGDLIGAGARTVGNKIGNAVRTVMKPTQQAQRVVGSSVLRDFQSGEKLLTPPDKVFAQQYGLPLLNADRGGTTTRALARSVANQSPEARALIEKTASDRFGSQGQRVTNFVESLMGGNTESVAAKEALKIAAQRANAPAYKAAYIAGDKPIYSKQLERLVGTDSVSTAIKSALKTWRDNAVKDGFGAMNPPFVITETGGIIANKGAKGVPSYANLQFWDYVKRAMDRQIGIAYRAGDSGTGGTLTNLKNQIVGELDRLVPKYAEARGSATSFFGAQDALEAGGKFFSQTKATRGATNAILKMKPAERELFATGYASKLIDTVNASRDRVNVINNVFGSEARRQQIRAALGAEKATALETMVRVETVADQLRNVVSGSSTTTRQWVELGLAQGGQMAAGGTAGYFIGGHDPQSAIIGALAARGIRYSSNAANQKVLQEVGKILASSDPALMKAAVVSLSKTPAYLKALTQLNSALRAATMGGSASLVSQAQAGP